MKQSHTFTVTFSSDSDAAISFIIDPSKDLEFAYNDYLYRRTKDLYDPYSTVSENLAKFAEKVDQRTKLLDIYVEAVRKTVEWFYLRDEKVDGISTDLSAVLEPFRKRIIEQIAHTHFKMLRNLDAYFFGVQHAEHWRHEFESPNIGDIQNLNGSDNSRMVKMHGIATMWFPQCNFSEATVAKSTKKNEQRIRAHVEAVVKALDDALYY